VIDIHHSHFDLGAELVGGFEVFSKSVSRQPERQTVRPSDDFVDTGTSPVAGLQTSFCLRPCPAPMNSPSIKR
jgi:hypothetical protein